jgi:D-tyrosyl-tRNA(Tyr) deacylase
LFLGIGRGDGLREVRELASKVVQLRIFENETGKFDQSLKDVGGEALVVSQFTLYADCSKGRRPSFTEAECPQTSRVLYENFIQELDAQGIKVAAGLFGERMEVHLVNEGPVTIYLEIPPSLRPPENL